MANANTLQSQIFGTIEKTLAPLQSAVIGTTESQFQLNNGAISLTGGGVVPLPVASSAGTIGSVVNNGIYAGQGRAFRVRAFGHTESATAACTLTLKLYQVPASVVAAGLTFQTLTGYNAIAASTARAITNGKNSFQMNADLQVSASYELQGSFSDTISNLVDASAAITAVAMTSEADLNFILTATLSSATPVSTVTTSEFSIEQV